MENELRPFWNRMFRFNWKFGLFLIVLVCIPRFILVLNANASQNYSYIGLIMVVSAVVPFIFLNKYGLKSIGIKWPGKYRWLLIALAAGLSFSILLYLAGQGLYGSTYENWYNYIGRSYNIPPGISQHDRAVLFAVTAGIAMTVSPVGEELFFRGIVHTSFAVSLGDKKASLADASAFALTHVSHFGLVVIDKEWKFLALPSLIWVLSMFLVSILFFASRKYSGSILGAIISHAAFNFGMIYCIFYLMKT